MYSIENKKIILLGGTGFLGNALIESLLKENIKINLLARKAKTRHDLQKYNANSKIKKIDWNLSDLETITLLLLTIPHGLTKRTLRFKLKTLSMTQRCLLPLLDYIILKMNYLLLLN